jgi:uncharacterized Zn-binding protein involved in type VI secretion
MPPAARTTDPTTHGAPLAPGPGSTNVMIGGKPAWRAMIDQHACPAVSISGADGVGSVLMGCPTVFVNGQMACRLGDIVVEKPGLAMGPMDPIIMGCPTVIIGVAGVGAPVTVAHGPCATQDEAARAALTLANPQSISDNLEYAGLIYRGADGLYYFTGPVRGTDQGANPFSAPVPAGTQLVGDYHAHGDYSTADPITGAAVRTSDPTRDNFNSDNFSTTDKTGIAGSGAGIPGYAGYLGTPSGTFRRFDAATGSDTTL